MPTAFQLVPALFLAAAACASSAGLRTEPFDLGQSRHFAAPLDQVVPAARAAIEAVGLEIDDATQVDSVTWMILAKKGMSAFSWGELVRVVVSQEPDAVAVRVITKRKLATNITAKGDWSDRIFERMDAILAQP